MDSEFKTSPESRYPVCLELMPELRNIPERAKPLSEILMQSPESCGPFPFLADLAKIEESAFRMRSNQPSLPERVAERMVNPALEVVDVNWRHLAEFISERSCRPEPGSAYVLVLVMPKTGRLRIQSAGARELLALKIAAEDIDSRAAAAEGGVSVGEIDDLLFWAERQGLLLAPESRIKRADDFPPGAITDPDVFSSSTFALQWHITQACDLTCRHCYDRSERKEMPLSDGIKVLDDLYDFCRTHNVFGQVSFSGGNPMLYRHFDTLYKEAADRGFMTAVLGNPMPRDRIEKMLDIQKPEFFQVSLEGMETHNDYIRGNGHFKRTMDFLEMLGELGVYRMVMLTLTRDNAGQVLALAERVKRLSELFTFIRLAAVGQGAQLAAVAPEDFPDFLAAYLEAAKTNPIMGLKDNLFNLLRWQRGVPTGGGCTGHGCGAAFNFVSLLPDGEVHACRKLPSLIGNIFEHSLADIYHGPIAERYRAGSNACRDCPVRPVCGSCLAVLHGCGKDVFNDPDPYCFQAKDKDQAYS